LSFARHWLQLEDVRLWQERQPTKPRSSSNRLKAWTPYFVGAVLVLFAALRLFRLMRQGI
jgi:hypothetical protein